MADVLDQTRFILERLWLAAILLLIVGWIGVLASPGSSRGFGLVVYIATAGLVCLAIAAVVRFAARSFHA